MVLTIVSFVVVLVVLVIAHELGHFVTAKASGVKVEEFGLGFSPRVFGVKWGETTYSINAIPLGGFVKLAGEEDPKVPNSLAGKSTGTRVLVLSAGSLMNFLLPFILFAVALMVPQDVAAGKVTVNEVATGSPAERAGIRAGDTLVSINQRPIRNLGEMQRSIQINLGEKVDIVVKHSDGTLADIQVVPRWRPPQGQGAIGIAAKFGDAAIIKESKPFWQAIPMGVRECIEAFILFKNGVIGMIIGTVPVAVAGPVGIAQMTGEVARSGFSPLLEFAAFLSINLAIVNILPLPALDGGRIAFVLLEWVRRGKRVSPKTENFIHMVGFAMLMALVLLVTYQDILRIIAGESFIP